VPEGDSLTVQRESLPREAAGKRPAVIAAIPCFNEERSIGSVVLAAKRYVDKVVVVDDGSADSSAEIASEAGAVVYRHGRNKGYGAAVRSALEKGVELGGEIVVLLDGDGQHDPREIPAMLKPVLTGEAEVVVGSRFLGRGSRPPLYRRVGQRALTTATNLSTGCKLTDSQSGFRAFSARAIRRLDLSEGGMSISSEMQFAIGRAGLKVAEVPITVAYAGKAKRNPLEHGTGVLARIVVLFSLRHPMLLFGLPGLALLGEGVALGMRVLSIYSLTSQFAVGTALGTILLSLAGLLALFTALMLQAMKELLKGGAAQLAREVREGHRAKEDDESGTRR